MPNPPDPFGAIPPDVLNTDELAERLGYGEVTIRGWASKGQIPGKMLGKEWRFWWPSVVIALFYNGETDDHADGPAAPPKPPPDLA